MKIAKIAYGSTLGRRHKRKIIPSKEAACSARQLPL